jgi:hypothetical protein
MAGWQRVAVGFALGGVITLLLHPGSRGLMLYVLQADRIKKAEASSAFASEPLELFPPLRSNTMDVKSRFLTAYRIARRLNTPKVTANKNDCDVAYAFASQAIASHPDNAYWEHFAASMAIRGGNIPQFEEHWERALRHGRWDDGVSALTEDLWAQYAAAEGKQFAWQGVRAMAFASPEPARFILMSAAPRVYDSLEARGQAVLSAGLILRNATSFATGDVAVILANVAIFGPKSTSAMDRREYVATRGRLVSDIGAKQGESAGRRMRAKLNEMESWENFVSPGQNAARSTRRWMSFETVATASLPSALLFASMVFGAIALAAKLLEELTSSIPHVSPAPVVLAAVVAAAAAYSIWGSALLGIWVLVAISTLALPMTVGKAETLDWHGKAALWIRFVCLFALLLAVAGLIAGSPAGIHLLSDAIGALPSPRTFSGMALLALSVAAPVAAIYARIYERPILSTLGSLLNVGCTFAAILGLISATMAAPLCIWQDRQDRAFVLNWLRNEPDTFRVDETQ